MLIWACCEHRAARHADYRGHALLVDWDAKRVVRRVDAPELFDADADPDSATRYNRGVRGVLELAGEPCMLTQGGLLSLDAQALAPGRGRRLPQRSGGHYAIHGPDGLLWYNACVPDAILAVDPATLEVRRRIDLADCDEIVDRLGLNPHRYEPDAELHAIMQTALQAEVDAGRADQLHVNTLQWRGDTLYAFACRKQALLEVWPRQRVVFRDERLQMPHDGCFLPDGRLIVSDSSRSAVRVYAEGATDRGGMLASIAIPRPPHAAPPRHAKPGFVRGMLHLGGGRVLVGTSPFALYEIDVDAASVVGGMVFGDDPSQTCHGISVAGSIVRAALCPTHEPPVRLNLGGGFRWRQPGWICLDATLGYDLAERLLADYGDASVEAIFCSHTLEHLPVDRAAALVRDCRRVLKPGGVLRLVLPDCERLVRAHNDGDDALLADPTFARHFPSVERAVVALGGNPCDPPSQVEAKPHDRHWFFWDRYSLQWLLMWAGFERVQPACFGRSRHAGMAKAATMDKASGFPVSGFDNPLTEAISVYIEGVAASAAGPV
ncbi:MAG: methyltransferase domain-containing protein [Planctomycetota bacterium]